MNKITAEEAMRLALEALTESVDLVAAELTGYKEIYSGYPSRAGRIASMQEGLDAHRNAIAQLVAILADEATQPPQDERSPKCPRHGVYMCVSCMHSRSSAAEPAQPIALSTLTDMQLAAAAYDGYDEYWTEDSKGIQTEAWAASAKAVLALAASAPAQQPTPPQPVAAEVMAMLNKLPRFRYGYSYNGGDARSLGYIADPEGPIVRYADIVAALVPTQKVEMNKITPPPAYACIHRANGKDKCSRWCGDSAKCIASPMLEDARAAIELRYTSQGAASEPESTNPYRVGSNAALWWQRGHDSVFSGTGSDESKKG